MACFKHEEYDEACFGCKVSTINISSSATPNKSGAAITSQKDKKLSQDMAAYKRLRADGLQPKGIDDSAVLERHASTKEEVEYGHLFKDKAQIREAVEGMEKAREIASA